jgi:branched-chain amino acid transport system ATP-binding protein
MLEISELHASYGKVEVLHGVSLRVPAGAIVALIGANGAGKTTMLAAITGQVLPTSGRVLLEGRDITGHPPHRVVRHRLSLVPEGRLVVASLTVEENLLVGGHSRAEAEVRSDRDQMFERFPRLRERRTQLAGSLSGGEQQMLAIGRALMARPKVLLLDEPSMGLAPQLVSEIFQIICEINSRGTSVLLVEQNARKALSIASHAYVLEGGAVALEGSGNALLHSREVIDAYLGGTAANAA